MTSSYAPGVTRNGICYSLDSDALSITAHGLRFWFSSGTHLNKFTRELRKREEWLRDSLTRRFKCSMYLDVVAAVQLYTQVETRGFRITTNDGMEYRYPHDIIIIPDAHLYGVYDDGTL